MFCVKGSLRRSRVRENAKTLTSSLMRVEIITHAPSASQARHLPPGGRLMLESVYTVASNNSVAENAFVRCRYMPTKNHPSNEWFVEGYYRQGESKQKASEEYFASKAPSKRGLRGAVEEPTLPQICTYNIITHSPSVTLTRAISLYTREALAISIQYSNSHKHFNITEQFNVPIIYKNCTCLSNSCIYSFTTL